MRKDATRAALRRLRREGIRATSGPLTACAEKAPDRRGRLIVALGRTAGKATVRSRIRRIAREVYARQFGRPARIDLVLLARGDVSEHARRHLRARLSDLLRRLAGVMGGRHRHAGGR